MSATPETTSDGYRRIAIEPVSRVEGHGKITLLLDDAGHVAQARLHITEFRGFEKFIQGRPYWELPLLVQRLCGICPVSHHLAAGKAIDRIAGVSELTPAATRLRRLLHFGQTLQSHALHFFHLASPDLLLGYDSEVARRNIIGVLADHPDVALQGIRIRKYGQEVIRHISGKRVHGIAAVPGGMNRPLAAESVEALKEGIDTIVDYCVGAVALSRRLCLEDEARFGAFGTLETPYLSLTGENGALELYDGPLRVRDADGTMRVDGHPCDAYHELVAEEAKSWSYMKFPFLRDVRAREGGESGWYRVGPLARVNNCDHIGTPLAEAERQAFMERGAPLCHQTLGYHWSRMIEALHCAEAIRELLAHPDIGSDDLRVEGEKQREGVGVIEAPRGTLFHHYRVDDDDRVEMANLIVSTTSNNQAMNESVRQVAYEHLDGQEVTPGLLNLLEVAVRAYDPCLSCATHAMGEMPLSVELLGVDGTPLHRLTRDGDGSLHEGSPRVAVP